MRNLLRGLENTREVHLPHKGGKRALPQGHCEIRLGDEYACRIIYFPYLSYTVNSNVNFYVFSQYYSDVFLCFFSRLFLYFGK